MSDSFTVILIFQTLQGNVLTHLRQSEIYGGYEEHFLLKFASERILNIAIM